MLRFVTVHKFVELSGYTEHAVRGKIRDAEWLEGRVWSLLRPGTA